jgi:hypothetical protein
MTSKIKKKPIREYLGLIIYPIKPSAGLFFLIKSHETFPLNVLDKMFMHNYNYDNLRKFCTKRFMQVNGQLKGTIPRKSV